MTRMILSMLITALFIASLSASAPQTSTYGEVLNKYVSQGKVDYSGLEKNGLSQLDSYLKSVAESSLPKGKNKQMGFYIDAYNALVLRSVIKHGRPKSVLDIKSFFSGDQHTVAGKKVTLDQLEKKVLNPLAKDPRTHFVLVCGAIGCPILESEPYHGSSVSQRMEKASKRYLDSKYGAIVTAGSLQISQIFKWYQKDFGGAEGVLSFVKKYLSAEQKSQLGATPKVSYINYNWQLNKR